MAAILFLDDDPDRHALVDELLRELVSPRTPRRPSLGITSSIDHAWSADEAVKLMNKRRYDAAFLDHDLDMFVPGAPNGMSVVDYIVSVPRSHQPRKVIVHSLNQGTAPERMMLRLAGRVRSCLRAPFASVEMVDELCRFIHGS